MNEALRSPPVQDGLQASRVSTVTSTIAAPRIVLALSERKFDDAHVVQQAKRLPKHAENAPKTPSLDR